MAAPRNFLTDVAGLAVGNAHDARIGTGVTVVLFDEPTTASVAVVGGAPAGRDTECLEPDRAVQGIDALVFAGGSAFGLDAASGTQAWLRERGRGFDIRGMRVPIVPQAICFDLLNGGDKDWGRTSPYPALAYEACRTASAADGPLGSVGAGYGATTVDLKGGLGSASVTASGGATVAALAVVNAVGSAVIGNGPWFWAGAHEEGREFGGLGWPDRLTPEMRRLAWKGGPQPGTTLALVATDARLTKATAKRLAMAAQGGLAKGLSLSHAISDGDMVFAAATGRTPLLDPASDLIELGALAATCLARAIARGVYEATALPYPGAQAAWRNRFGMG